MAAYRFHITRHAAERAAERGLKFEDLKNVVSYPDKQERSAKGGHGGIVYKFSKCVDGQTLIAVGEVVRNSDCWILTGYYAS